VILQRNFNFIPDKTVELLFMSGSDRPLLEERGEEPTEEISHDLSDLEDDSAVHSPDIRPTNTPLEGQWSRRSQRIAVCAVTAIISAGVVIAAVLLTQNSSSPVLADEKKSLIMMVSDGMGIASLTMARSFHQYAQGLPFDRPLNLDAYLLGSSRTRSTDSLVTDSAAGATAFSCAQKSYNGAISVLPNHSLCGTVLEAAKRAGYMTGLVVTTRITDATPACFNSHVDHREKEDDIALQQVGGSPLGLVTDLMVGGGRCHFIPRETDGSCRGDSKDVVSIAKSRGFTYISDREGFDKAKSDGVSLPLLGLFAGDNIPFDVDRDPSVYPSLAEMAQLALELLTTATKDNEKGFFLMIEGSRIDHAGHANDPKAQVHEVLAYDEAFSHVLTWLDRNPGAVVSTSDHETGGLSTARQIGPEYPEYLWLPEVLANASKSTESLAKIVTTGISNDDIKEQILHEGLGIEDASDEEMSALHKVSSDTEATRNLLSDMLSQRAQIGWSTHGHSGVDVPVFFHSTSKATNRELRSRPQLLGNHENTEVGQFLQDYLQLNTDEVTKLLNNGSG